MIESAGMNVASVLNENMVARRAEVLYRHRGRITGRIYLSTCNSPDKKVFGNRHISCAQYFTATRSQVKCFLIVLLDTVVSQKLNFKLLMLK